MAYTDSKYTFRTAVEYFLHFQDRSGFLSDDNPFSKKAIAFHLRDARAAVIRKYMDEGKMIPEEMKQYMNCIELEKADQNECPGLPASGCVWLKTKSPLPKFITIQSITNSLGTFSFNPLKWGEYKYVKDSRIKSQTRQNYYSIKNTSKGTYLYIYTQSTEQEMLKAITVAGVFEDPIEAARQDECIEDKTEIECNPLDVDFYTCAEMREQVFQMVAQSLNQRRQGAIIDERNDDGSDDRIDRYGSRPPGR